MAPGAEQRRTGWGPLAGLLAALALPAAAQEAEGSAFAPCLAAHPALEDYVAAFEAAGWTLAQGEAREAALRGPAEIYYRAMYSPDPEPTPEALDATLAEVRDWSATRLAGAAVLTRGEVAAMVELSPGEPVRLLCVLAAADLPETDRLLGARPPGPFGGLAVASFEPTDPPGARDVRLDAMRVERGFKPPEPLPGTEAILVTLTVGTAP